MNRKLLTSAALVSTTASFGMLIACVQSGDPGSVVDTNGTSEALATVIDCQTQAFSCAADAQAPSGLTSCNDGLRACLASLFPSPPQFDGGLTLPTPPPRPVFDAGLPPIRFFDAGLPVPPVRLPDAGLRLPPPIALPDAGAASGQACLTELQTCLTTSMDVVKCAADARTCLSAAAQARCDAQQAACNAAGLPKPLCDAQRAACF